MNVINPFQMNDWEIKKFLTTIFLIQILIISLIKLDNIGIQIPIIQQMIGFIYLTFIPGVLILRCLKIHKLGIAKTVLYSVGLSITTIMFTGFFINTISSVFNLNRPISLNVLLTVLSLIVIFLCILSYIRDKDFSDISYIHIENFSSPYLLVICLLPFLSIFGTYLMNFFDQNILQLSLIPVLCIIIYVTLFKNIKSEFYPFSVFMIALAILLHASLFSTNLWGYDINKEYYIAGLVLKNSFWNLNIRTDINAMLSVVILAPTLSIITNLSLTWVFKIIYPILFSFVPMGLYLVFKDQIKDEKISFLACVFFMSLSTFGFEMLQLARQEIAELFLVLLLLIIIEDLPKMKKSLLTILFGVSIVVSHYGLSYMLCFYLITALIIIALIKNHEIKEFFNKTNSNKNMNLNNTFILLFLVFTLSWYIYMSHGSIFVNIVQIGTHIYESLLTGFLNPDQVQGLSMATASTNTHLRFIFKIMNYITQFFIIIGVFSLLLLKNRKMKINVEYKVFVFISLLILIFSVTIPTFSSSLNTTRIYQLTSIFLAPIYVLGGIQVLKSLRHFKVNFNNKTSLRLLTVFTITYFLFSSGFLYQISNDQPSLLLLNNNLDGPVFSNSEIEGAYWLSNYENGTIYTDNIRSLIFNRYSLLITNDFNSGNFSLIKNDSYIYLGKRNILNNKIALKKETGTVYSSIYYKNTLDSINKIYSNGGSEIYST